MKRIPLFFVIGFVIFILLYQGCAVKNRQTSDDSDYTDQKTTSQNPSETDAILPEEIPTLCDNPEVQKMGYRSEKGELINKNVNKDLYLQTLLMEEYSIESFTEAFGKDYQLSDKGKYIYPNGLYFVLYEDSENILYFGFDNDAYIMWPNTIKHYTCNLLSNPGDEHVILFVYKQYKRLLIHDEKSKEILYEYNLGYFDINNLKFDDFLNDGTIQLYFEYGHNFQKKGIYKFVDDEFTIIYDENSFGQYKDNVGVELKGNEFIMNVHLDDYNETLYSLLPDKVFSSTEEPEDKASLISIDSLWELEKKGHDWFVKLKYNINYPMIKYISGIPNRGVSDNRVMYNSLGRVDILLEVKNQVPVVKEIAAKIKYDTPALLKIKDLGNDEEWLVTGPELMTSMDEAYIKLGGDPKNLNDEYLLEIEFNGVVLRQFCEKVVYITVKTKDYETTRGMRVGDSIEKVESLYGKPDVGFSGDELVSYKCGSNDYYRGIDIRYKDGIVESYSIYELLSWSGIIG